MVIPKATSDKLIMNLTPMAGGDQNIRDNFSEVLWSMKKEVVLFL
jgi:hypothetical protein